MSIRIKEIVAVGLVSTLLFPIVMLGVLLMNGTLHLSMGVEEEEAVELKQYLEMISPAQDTSDLEQSRLFQANRQTLDQVSQERQALAREAERLETLKAENLQLKKEIEAARGQIEKLVEERQVAGDERIETLARVYGAMKAVEAAPILLTLDDQTVASIVKRIPEVRSQAKLMAALGTMDRNRTAAISKILGWQSREGWY